MKSNQLPSLLATVATAALLAACASTPHEKGFVSLFNGQNLDGWKYIGAPGGEYFVTNGLIDCPVQSKGNLITEQEFSDFTLRFDYKYEADGNNGVAIRAPMSTNNLTYVGTEIQLLDDIAPKHAHIHPWQYNGSVYGVVAANHGTGNIGVWNSEEITYLGRHVHIVLNGRVIVDADLNTINDPAVIAMHPGMFRTSGHLGFLGHSSHFQFRDIRLKDLAAGKKDNTPPEGFQALFDGDDIKGWKGLVANPPERAKMSPETLAAEQVKADARMTSHWKAMNGEIVFDGHGDNLCTARDYKDFELLVDWKIPARGDSGIYLRGSPQVQIWEPKSPGQFTPVDGSGGLYNNEINPRHPLLNADHPVGEWNHFRIIMVGEKVHVFLNNELVVNDTTLENYWERSKPIYATGAIELQNHFGPLWFKNIYVREINTNGVKSSP
jgi:hypothetical protein